MLPPSLMSDGYPKTIHEIRLAIEKRITNQTQRLGYTPSYHRGTPDPTNLPKEKLGVWLDWDRTGRDPQEPNEETMLVTNWKIYIVAEADTSDKFGGHAPLGEQVWGGILKTFTETNDDLGLDGACDYIPTPEADHFTGTIAGGDRRVEVIEMAVEVHWQAELVRRPI